MKLAISSHDGKRDTQFSSRFGRCEYFLFVDTDSHSWESHVNPAASARGGAGTQVVQFLSGNQIDAAISGRYGPNAYTALEAAGIKGFEADQGTPEELVERFLAGELKQVSGPTGKNRHQ